MNKKNNITYNDLAWIDTVIAPPQEYADETHLFCKLIKKHSKIKVNNILHFGSGAGINDWSFKKFFKITGVDLSINQIKVAKDYNPSINYVCGDMRNMRFNQKFDSVIIPDSIGYMLTEDDLYQTIQNAYNHLQTGGLLFIVAHTKEEFQNNNFVYTGSKNDVEIVIFENNYILPHDVSHYEATFVYLIRRNGSLKVYNDTHIIGLFSMNKWLEIFNFFGFTTSVKSLDHSYDKFLLNNGEYPLTIFICIK